MPISQRRGIMVQWPFNDNGLSIVRRVEDARTLLLNLCLELCLLHISHGVLAPVWLQTRAVGGLRADGGGRVHALGAGGLLHLRRLALPAGEQIAQLLVQFGELGRGGGDRHDGWARLEHLAGLVVLLGVLRQVREVGLQTAHVAGDCQRVVRVKETNRTRRTLRIPSRAAACRPRAWSLLPGRPCPAPGARTPP
jgi:hypothetical protein